MSSNTSSSSDKEYQKSKSYLVNTNDTFWGSLVSLTQHDSAQYDGKSLWINLASICLFSLPFLWYYDSITTSTTSTSSSTSWVGVWVVMGVFGIAFLWPPTCSWKRPHPYSDQMYNRSSKQS